MMQPEPTKRISHTNEEVDTQTSYLTLIFFTILFFIVRV